MVTSQIRSLLLNKGITDESCVKGDSLLIAATKDNNSNLVYLQIKYCSMKTKLVLLFPIFFFLLCLRPLMASESESLIRRVLPKSANAFVVQEIPADNGRDVFEVEAGTDGKIILRGNNGVSVATAFNWYLKQLAHVSYDWQAISPLEIEGSLPLPNSRIRKICTAKERFFNNTCTFGYTFAFWDWQQWQRFIDWMAMNGINRPLMLAGQEAVWLEVWKSFGMTDMQVRTYFSGPAHLPWHRMANMDKWGGPLPVSYIEGQRKLQQQILACSRSLGMQPILPAFAGHVPELLKSHLPKANISQIVPGWGGMVAKYTTYFLDPTDKLFEEIQKKYLLEQEKLYGTDHLYSADPFNEITPPSWEPEYLAKVGKTIYETMSKVDKKAVWYQMTWTFFYDSIHWTQPRLSAMIKAVPVGKLVFLDYACEQEEYFRKCQKFYGAPFIWCYLGNFGGNIHLAAPMNKVSKRIIDVLPISNCLGVGSTLEGLNVNPGIYELTFEMPWRSDEKFDLDVWIADYAERRAQRKDANVTKAWQILKEKVLVDSAVTIWNHSVVFQVSPVMDLKKGFWSTDTHIFYDNVYLAQALESMFKAAIASKQTDVYKFDVVNLTRQVLGNYGSELHDKMINAYNQRNTDDFRKYSAQFVQLGLEIDRLLGTRHEFLLGKWLSDASRWGKTSAEKAYYERNAREIITTWHVAGGGLKDYSNRQWNGLMRTYYIPRWIEFIKRLDQSLVQSKPMDMNDFTKWTTVHEQKWVDEPKFGFASIETGNAVEEANQLFEKYRDVLLKK